MNSTILVAKREFLQRVRSRGFLIQLILMPIVLAVVVAFVGFSGAGRPPEAPADAEAPVESVGFVDRAEIIQTIPESIPSDLLRRYADMETAAAALAQGEIAAYYVIPEDYRTSGEVRWVGADLPIVPPDTGWFEELLLANVLANADAEYREQLRRPFNVPSLRAVQVEPEPVTNGGSQDLNWIPFIVTLVVLIPLFTAGGYLFEGLVQEKSNRVMELLLVSLKPSALLSGKMLGLSMLVLVQYVVWGAIGLAILLVARAGPISAFPLESIDLSVSDVLLMALYALGAYALYAALMAGIGAVTASIENNRIWIFIITVPMLIPIYLWAAIVAAPNGGLAVALSLFPFSAPVAMLMRLTATSVPLWQLAVSLALLFLTALGTIWLMGRLFRAQTLLSGESLSPRRMWAALTH